MKVKSLIIPIIIVIAFVGFGILAGMIVAKKAKPASDNANSGNSTAKVDKVEEEAKDTGTVAGAETSNTDASGFENTQENATGDSTGIQDNGDWMVLPSTKQNVNSNTEDYDGFANPSTEPNTRQTGNVKTSVKVVDNDDYSGFAE